MLQSYKKYLNYANFIAEKVHFFHPKMLFMGLGPSLHPLLRYALQYYSFVGRGLKGGKEGYYLYIIYILYINSKYFYLHILLFFKHLCG